MAIEADFAEMMPHTVTLHVRSSTDFHGKPTYAGGAGTSLTCRVEEGRNVTRGSDARDITEDGRIYVYGTTTATVNDKITLPDGAVVRVVAVETLADQSAAHHTVIHYGRSGSAG